MRCCVCGCHKMRRIYDGKSDIHLSPEHFKITDSHYGTTLPRYRCTQCGFVECDTSDVTAYYRNLEDSEYIESGSQRAFQFSKLLENTKHFLPDNAQMLDIGAGSGIFIKQAIKRGYSCIGLEPSSYLADCAVRDGLPVINGTFPDDCPNEKFDAVFLTDVIEHIADPLSMLSKISNVLKENGIVVVTTPDVSSMAAKILGSQWWHYRIAHIGYYNKKTLAEIMKRAGMTAVKWKYAKWYFSTKYIA